MTTSSNNFTATILVDQEPAVAFRAISNFRGWWSEEIDGPTDQPGQEFFYHYQEIHLCKMKLTTFVPDKQLVYLVLENEFSFVEDKTEWVGSKLVFDIRRVGAKTKVTFTHEGLVPENACYNVCQEAWGTYIQKSLYDYITTGKGAPNPKDKDGYNALLAEKWQLTGK